MQRITDSIDIDLPLANVFGFLREIEPRLRLSPSYRLLSFEKLTEGDIGVGSRIRIAIMSGGKRSEYIAEVIELVENKKIATRDVEGRVGVTLTVEPTRKGTRLTHDEEFTIPADLLYPQEEERPEMPLWLRIIRSIITFERVRFTDTDRERRVEEILEALRANLRIWLSRIKETLESGRVK